MAPEHLPQASRFSDHLYSALSLAERASCLRQAGKGSIGSKVDASRTAATLDRWKSQRPFPTGDFFKKRLRQDGLTETDLLAILGLPPEAYSELITTPPDWVRELERLYLTPRSLDDAEFSRYAEERTNGFLLIAYPLYREGLRRFREGVGRLPAVRVPYDPGTVERLVLPNLFKRLEEILDLVMVLELNVARLQGVLKGENPEQRFDSFCERLGQMDVQLSIAREYPVLFRSLYVITMDWVDYSLELLDRLSNDWDRIRASLAAGAEPGSLTSVAMGAAETHRRGRTVAILGFSTGFKLVYKPHSLSVDVHFGEFLAWVNQAGFETPFRILKIIDRGCYGWSEFVAHQPCSNRDEVERFYQRLGGYLAIFYVMRARDMHFENVIATAEFPVPVDLESLFHGDGWDTETDDPAIHAFQLSVMKVMLLPQPIYGSETDAGVDMSGFGAKSGQPFPVGIALSWERAGTDQMRLGRNKTLPTMVARNRPILEGQEVAAGEYVEAFLTGFRRVYGLIEERRDELQAIGGLLDRFREDEVRFVARATAAYIVLLKQCQHPDQLRNAINRDQVLDGLWLDAAQQTHLARLIPAEARDLQRGDVPVFTSRPHSCDLWTSEGEQIPEVFERPAMALVREGLHRLGKEDLMRQESFIRAAVASVGEVAQSRDLIPTSRKLRLTEHREAIDLARAVGDMLCREALENEFCASWIGITPVGTDGRSTSLHPLDLGLYNGLSGCSLFLAYLTAVTGDKSYERIAKKTVTLIRRHLDRGRACAAPVSSLGAFSGLGGIIYTLAHLAVLWEDASLIDEAKSLAAGVPALTETDNVLDVIGGSAGAIAGLEVLNRISGSDHLLKAAMACGERLLKQQQPQSRGTGWRTEIDSTQPLTGFSHGAAGIAWAMLKLAAWSGEARFREAAESAIAYERSTFVAEEANWPDYRLWPGKDLSSPRCEAAWCHGAPGIGLARIDSLQYIDDPETREEIQIALRKTVESNFGTNHCLCHGDLGNLDILLHAAQRMDDSWWREAGKRLACQTLAGIAERGCLCGGQTILAPPGLMVGMAGIGYGLLRLACPERVPSVLVLAPPAEV
jgi:type 2 lantibiotic biosynthesis protein LanM